MASDSTTVENDAIRLSHRDRAKLALRLIESLDPGRDEDVGEIWLAEAERRLKACDEGTIEVRDIDDDRESSVTARSEQIKK